MASSSSLSPVVFLITGASKGLGRAIATVASRYYAPQNQNRELRHDPVSRTTDSNDACHGDDPSMMPSLSFSKARFVLVARSSKGIEETKREILSTTTTSTTTTAEDVICRAMDLSDLDRLDANMDVLLDDLDRLCCLDDNDNVGSSQENTQRRKRVVFVNNAGSLGHLGPCVTSPSLEDMRQTIDLNVTSSLWLSVRFAQYVKQQKRQEQQQQQQRLNATVVNISSLVAVSDDFLSMGIYSAGKAARERYHTLLAKEELKNNEASSRDDFHHDNIAIKTLNYAPGPLETEMTREIRGAEALDVDLRPHFQKKLLDPKDSALKLIKLLDENNFDSGTHIDYYDLPDNNKDDHD